MPALQRRYSVTGQTPPDNEVPKQQQQQHPHSPKLQALDTTVQSTPNCGLPNCGFYESVQVASKPNTQHEENIEPTQEGDRGRRVSHQTMGRMVSKRSATQLPSPSTPTTHELPPKIARLGLDSPELYMDMDDEGVFTDPLPSHLEDPFSSGLPTILSRPLTPLSLDTQTLDTHSDSGVESLALTPSPSSPTILPTSHPPTFLTLPPELRHQIYTYLPDLILPHPLIYCLSTFQNALQHPLSSVSRLVRAEALAIFYSYNTWTIKLEFRIMYEAFYNWIVRLGERAGLLRLVTIAVRGRLFKPGGRAGTALANGGGAAALAPGTGVGGAHGHVSASAVVEAYTPPDGDAAFHIDLSERFAGGKVTLVRNDGTDAAGQRAVAYLEGRVQVLWERRRAGTLGAQDWVDLVEMVLGFVGGRLS